MYQESWFELFRRKHPQHHPSTHSAEDLLLNPPRAGPTADFHTAWVAASSWRFPPLATLTLEADVVSSQKKSLKVLKGDEWPVLWAMWVRNWIERCKAHISTVESEIRPSFRNSELLKGASKWYPGKQRYEASACLTTLEPVLKKTKMTNVQHRILACPRSTLHLHYRHLMP